ncbi:ARF GTPase-activating protein GIT2 isoform X9 [Panthera pardus]|uniref:Arf-GAP domain-containing protein n=5 Tax=Felidae TaxID=9681 RepID=A0ABI7YAI6_FELCA|nr:ARF GTPase-activating protein GIT2 isoform X8 [Lynx canadensis]XP_044898218.1 ARF GTPase-activating protein GIT2 isoform X10 [Felis catus]XP_045315135.1 ARF GTPase-activating protein GIT2 isoform X20 [Leopardus geoffroyi]XP_047683929.1 ARF GTPase-activating protein GIT2 isoform X10 [Prionailurus viverrinus]XP_053062038.1 ARF GTPase-activating protein GIT2 isoform X10 [Acinonyx jubatus]XP_053758096.1 ARF GTPase-activating protein GIT2 isoform X9 [Panthera pardus]VFV38574.1 arf gtpase-activa
MSKRLRSSEVCADCSGPDPSWASVNRGTFICDECCSVHRSLGRHVSQVRHLKHAPWPPTLLQMVETLYNNGANSIWEHSLLDPASVMSGRRKANPQDKVHPNKAEFIRAKYQMLAFVHRLPCRDDDSVTAKDLSKQLHSSVRTGNLETCLRLLSLGAQANFFHPEKGNTPLHVASKAGQILQAELLAVYGADPGTQDSSGKTPVDYARQGGHHELAERLVEIQYELTDRLAFYLCGRKPDHKNGQHFIIPQMADSSLDLSELAKAAKKKLQSLSNHLFEELAMDVYDEVDRRETDAVWLATQNHSTLVTETTVVPFLPVNPEYSSTRNQGRQKLARFNAHEFATLVIDILSDAKRRQQGSPLSGSKDNVELILKTISNQHSVESQDNDQPDYDSVASDEDTDLEPTASKANRQKSLDSDLSDGPVTVQEFMEVKNALVASEAKIQQLMKVNNNLSDELRIMQKKIGRSALVTSSSSLPSFPSTLSWSRDESARRASRLEKQNSTPESDYDNTPNDTDPDDTGSGRKGRQRSVVWQGDGSVPDTAEPHAAPSPILPSTEDVIRKTEQITKNIQELLRAAQENKHDSYIPCSERIHVAVTEMAALFPKKPKSDTVRTSLRLLTSSAYRLQSECKKTLPGDAGPPTDIQLVTQQVIQCAYDIAKAAKQLVTITTKENNN